MPTQSIDLSAVTDTTFGGSAVEQINLNGAGIWTKPASGLSLYFTPKPNGVSTSNPPIIAPDYHLVYMPVNKLDPSWSYDYSTSSAITNIDGRAVIGCLFGSLGTLATGTVIGIDTAGDTANVKPSGGDLLLDHLPSGYSPIVILSANISRFQTTPASYEDGTGYMRNKCQVEHSVTTVNAQYFWPVAYIGDNGFEPYLQNTPSFSWSWDGVGTYTPPYSEPRQWHTRCRWNVTPTEVSHQVFADGIQASVNGKQDVAWNNNSLSPSNINPAEHFSFCKWNYSNGNVTYEMQPNGQVHGGINVGIWNSNKYYCSSSSNPSIELK
jgi:hypothetical protein